MARLGDVCEIVTGSTPKSGCPEYWNGDINWVTPAELTDDTDVIYETQRKITRQAVIDSSLKPFPCGTVLLSSRAPIGKVAIAGTEMYCNQGFKNLICSDKIYNRYLFHFLRSKTQYLNSLGRGATFKEISKSIVADIEIPLPTLEEQRKIAVVLDKISDLTAKRRRQLDKLDELVKSRFVEMFGDVLLDEKKWQKQRLSEIAEIVDPHPSHRTPPFSKNGIPYIGLTECDYNMYRINFKKARMVSKEILEEHIKRYTIDEGDFIIGKIGTIGKPFWIPKERSYVLSANTLLIKPKTSAVCPAYLFDVFQTTYMKHIIELGMKSTSQPAFGIQKAREIAIPLPPMELQKQYSHFVNYINGIMLNVQKGFDTLSMLRKLLMQKYFCADIEVIE